VSAKRREAGQATFKHFENVINQIFGKNRDRSDLDAIAVERLSQTPVADAPFQLKKILVPIDFSACSKKALQYAVPFARQFNAAITFLYVVPRHFSEFDLMSEPQLESTLRDAARQLSALAREIVPREVSVQIEVRHGVQSIEIVKAAQKLETDLVIISTHGRTGRAHAFAGSVAEDVARLAPCPVLVVRENEHEFIQNGFAVTTASATAA
jgi:universal stress protein A